jgi:protein-tyrosine phosphatase
LFVCTGNICRSPTAAAVLRKCAAEAGLSDRIVCDSAGMEGWHVGRAPDPRAVRAANLRGYDMVELRARVLERRDFANFDLLIGMDRGHLKALERQRPLRSAGKVALFLSFSPELAAARGADVPDPYGGDAADFEHALDLIEQGMPGLLAALRGVPRAR